MGKDIQPRDGFFKSMKKYSNNDAYKKRQKELRESNLQLEKKDGLALVIAGFLVILIPTVIIVALMIIIPMLIFGIL